MYSTWYYEVLWPIPAVEFLELTLFLFDLQLIVLGNHFILGNSQPEDDVKSNRKDIFLPVDWILDVPTYLVYWNTAYCHIWLNSFWFSSTKTADINTRFEIQCFWKLTEWFSCTGVFTITGWTVFSKSFRGGEYWRLQNSLVLLLIITCYRRFAKILNIFRHICLYISQLFNNWSTPMMTICCFSRSGCKTL